MLHFVQALLGRREADTDARDARQPADAGRWRVDPDRAFDGLQLVDQLGRVALLPGRALALGPDEEVLPSPCNPRSLDGIGGGKVYASDSVMAKTTFRWHLQWYKQCLRHFLRSDGV